MSEQNATHHRVVIVGGGFGGLFAARQLGRSGYDVTLIDKRNFHTFQPLLLLTTGDVCTPHRVTLRRKKNIRSLMSTATISTRTSASSITKAANWRTTR